MKPLPHLALVLLLVALAPSADAATARGAKARRGTTGLAAPAAPYAVTFVEVPEVEPNDTREQAQPFACGDLLTQAAIGVVNDEDFVTFTVPPGHWITARTQDDPNAAGQQAGDLTLTLFDADGAQVAYSDDWGPDFHARMVYRSDAGGTYVLKIRGYDDGTIQGAYQAWVTCTVEGPPANDACAGAQWIECGPVAITGDLSFATDDFRPSTSGCQEYGIPGYGTGRDVVYAMQVSGGDQLHLVCSTLGIATLYLTDACGTSGGACLAQAGEAWPDSPAEMQVTFTQSGLYYLVVDTPEPAQEGGFTLSGSLTCNVVPAQRRSWGALKSIYR